MTTDDQRRLAHAGLRQLIAQGASDAELDAAADLVASLTPEQPTPARTPAPDPGQGPRPTSLAYDEYEAFAAAMGRRDPRRRR